MSVQTADIIVAGAGHNSLITASYLARAGYSVIALDARAIPGGGAATEELLGPGYLVDSCSTGHTLIQSNPLMADDELGLMRDYGLEYAWPDPVAHVQFPDGRHLTHYLDLDRTLEEFARFSRRDADAYARMLNEWAEVAPLFNQATNTPLGLGPSLDALLDAHPRANTWRRRRAMSAWEIIRYEFEDRHVQSYMLWQAYQTMVHSDAAGSGPLAYSIIAGRQKQSWSIPVGGSGKLTDALVGVFEAHGGRIVVDTKVSRIILEGGRAVGVETTDGREYRANKAVLSTIHVKPLLDMAPREAWGEDWVYGVETYDNGAPGFAVYAGADRPPVFDDGEDGVSAVSAGYAGWPEDILAHTRAAYDGVWRDEIGFLLVATPTLVDQSRVPVPGHHTVKMLNTVGATDLRGRSYEESVARRTADIKALTARIAPNFTEDAILAQLVKGPREYEAANPAMVGGGWHGGDRGITFAGPNRPVPGWAQYRTPIPGLYQTGATTYPGGSVTGAPGRNAATVMLGDLADAD
ncbi:phytoene desaturase family protein [Microbacterium sp. ASV49]|uniref:Pyridine nucleotide-disulfide oxidoreductase domain-containing protein 2 n=1 Tax=Microbacterium candidum TaxID=3041922 RepID=A0ABT7MWG6_9MICO|nr:NAD(P)/FAD-dependent oxidoreductase [Microbacterium sp. ASV49]MDL9978779.1 NAD(P)/FAD-dependent oxidoreductase [Microbacterium sp. ASV49]